MAKKAPMMIFSAKADDYIGKNSRIYEVLYGKNGIVDKADDFRYNGTGDIFLQNKLSYNLNGKKMFIPKQAKFENENMEYSDLRGWLIPVEKAEEFNKEYMKKQGDPEGWYDYFCWEEWENEENPRISFVWYD